MDDGPERVTIRKGPPRGDEGAKVCRIFAMLWERQKRRGPNCCHSAKAWRGGEKDNAFFLHGFVRIHARARREEGRQYSSFVLARLDRDHTAGGKKISMEPSNMQSTVKHGKQGRTRGRMLVQLSSVRHFFAKFHSHTCTQHRHFKGKLGRTFYSFSLVHKGFLPSSQFHIPTTTPCP